MAKIPEDVEGARTLGSFQSGDGLLKIQSGQRNGSLEKIEGN